MQSCKKRVPKFLRNPNCFKTFLPICLVSGMSGPPPFLLIKKIVLRLSIQFVWFQEKLCVLFIEFFDLDVQITNYMENIMKVEEIPQKISKDQVS